MSFRTKPLVFPAEVVSPVVLSPVVLSPVVLSPAVSVGALRVRQISDVPKEAMHIIPIT